MSAQNNFQSRFMDFYSHLGVSEREFAKNVGVSTGFIQSVKNGTSFGVDILSKILSTYPDLSLDWLINGKGSMFLSKGKKLEESKAVYHPSVVTIDREGVETIILVPQKAQAGYLIGLNDPEYFEKLPAVSVPYKFRNGVHRAFEVTGYSMLSEEGIGLHPTDLIFGRYVEKLTDIKDHKVYIIVSSAPAVDNIIVKRCYNTIKEYGWLLCKSDNHSGEYPDIHLDPNYIKEVWEWKATFTSYYPRTGDVYENVNEMQKNLSFMNSEVATLKTQVQELIHQIKLINP
jgi:hypothetical protein